MVKGASCKSTLYQGERDGAGEEDNGAALEEPGKTSKVKIDST